MTDQQHPITPPPELVEQWIAEIWHEGTPARVAASDLHIATQAARWSYEQRAAVDEAKLQKARDEELEACCNAVERAWNNENVVTLNDLLRAVRSARRPKPPSLKEQKQAIHAEIHQSLAQISANNAGALAVADPIRAALKRLQELEGEQ